MAQSKAFLPQKGNYKDLIVYQKAECIYDITYYFAHHFLSSGDRTIDQMVQAARSGKQNIAEGVSAATTSTEMEIKLINVAKASLQELLVDYEDFLRVRDLEQEMNATFVLANFAPSTVTPFTTATFYQHARQKPSPTLRLSS